MTADKALEILEQAAHSSKISGDLGKRLSDSGFTLRRLRVMGRALLRDGLSFREVANYISDLADDIKTAENAHAFVEGCRLRWDIAEAWITRPRLPSQTRAVKAAQASAMAAVTADDAPAITDACTAQIRVIDISPAPVDVPAPVLRAA